MKEWKQIKHFENYEVSKDGCVRRIYTPRGIRRHHNKHQAIIEHKNKALFLGSFQTREEAIDAYEKAYVDIHGLHPSNKTLKPQINKKGYPVVRLYKDRTWKWRPIHILVAEAFLGKRPEKHEVNHKDTNKQNNHVKNLEYVSRSENIRHAYRTGKIKLQKLVLRKGSEVHTSKLTETDVKKIRKLYESGEHSTRKLGECFGVTRHAIGNIIGRKTWKHI